MDILSQYFEFATFIVTLLGVPAAIFIYSKEQRLQRDEREYGTYDALDEKYIELQQLCIEYPELDIFDTPYKTPRKLTEAQEKQEEAIMLIRISIFERSFLMYQRTPTKAKSDQWQGWEDEINEWLERKNFRAVWDIHAPYYDKTFFSYFNRHPSAATEAA